MLDRRRLLKPWAASAVARIVPGRYQRLPLHFGCMHPIRPELRQSGL
jgi:hypothetical protein